MNYEITEKRVKHYSTTYVIHILKELEPLADYFKNLAKFAYDLDSDASVLFEPDEANHLGLSGYSLDAEGTAIPELMENIDNGYVYTITLRMNDGHLQLLTYTLNLSTIQLFTPLDMDESAALELIEKVLAF